VKITLVYLILLFDENFSVYLMMRLKFESRLKSQQAIDIHKTI